MLRTYICAVAALAASPAFAAARIGVLPFAPLAGDVPQGAGEKGADILAKELKNQSDFEVVPREAAGAEDGAAALSQARKALSDARAAVASHQGAAALAAYQSAVVGFEKAIQSLDSFDELVAAQSEMGVLLYRLGRDDDGQKAIAEALRLSPGQLPAAVAGSPSFTATAEGIQKSVAKLGKGSVRVESIPAGADVYVDGQTAGKTPVVLRDLPAGKHYLRALLPSGEKWGVVVDVAAKAEPHVRAQTGGGGPGGEVDGQLAENNLQPSVLAALKKSAAASKLALVVFGSLHRTLNGLALDSFLYSADKGTISRLDRVAFDTEMLEAGLQMDKVVAEVRERLGGGGSALQLPAKASPDLTADRELATEYHFGGTPDAPLDSPPAPSGDEPAESRGSRVIRREQPESE